MRQVYILNYSQLVASDLRQSVAAFATALKLTPQQLFQLVYREGGMPWGTYNSPALQQMARQGLIYRYRTDPEFGFTEFAKALLAKVSTEPHASFSEATFREAWNKMCEIAPGQVIALRQLMQLQQQHNFDILVLGATNRAHHEFIQAQFCLYNLDRLRACYALSYQMRTIDPQRLFKLGLQQFKAGSGLESFELCDLRQQPQPLQAIVDQLQQPKVIYCFGPDRGQQQAAAAEANQASNRRAFPKRQRMS